MAQAAAGNHGHHHAGSRGQGRRDQAGFVADAAGRVLIHFNARNPAKSTVSPERIMHSVSRLTSRSVMPEKKTAIRKADIW